MIDFERIDRALAWIKKNPSCWDQQMWRCSTGMCFAGVVAEQGAGKWFDAEDPDGFWSEYMVPIPGEYTETLLCRDPDADEASYLALTYRPSDDGEVVEELVHVQFRAARLLGFLPLEADPFVHERDDLAWALFRGTNQVKDLKQVRDLLWEREHADDA